AQALGDKAIRRRQNCGIDGAQAQLIHPEAGVSHRDDVYILLGIEAGAAEDNQHSLVRSAAEAAYSELLALEVPNRTDLRFRHQKIGFVLNTPCQDFYRCPADDSADAAGNRGDVIEASADLRRPLNVRLG